MDVLDGQSEVNRSVVRALEAIALQADKYDAQIAVLEGHIAVLTDAVAAICADLGTVERGLHRHSG